MDQSKWISTGLLNIAVVINSGADEQLDTCVWVGVEVNVDHGHNSTETSCEVPKQPSNGGYVNEADVSGHRYKRGDTIQYYCHRGHRLIGQAFRTCNGTAKKWEPDEPYCQPEYIGDLMRRLNAIEDKVNGMEQRLTSVEINTLETREKISAIDNKVLENDKKVTKIDSRLSSVVANVSSIESVISPLSKFREQLVGCSNAIETTDKVTVLKCVTMQLGVRTGHSVYESKWVIEDFKSKVSANRRYPSSPFYHTVPGYKFRLYGDIYMNSDIYIFLLLLPGQYDDQLTWPVTIRYDLTVLTNDGSEVLHRSQPGTCSEKRPRLAVTLLIPIGIMFGKTGSTS